MDLLIDPAYIEPPAQLDKKTFEAYESRLAALARFVSTDLMGSVSTETDVLKIYCRLCQGDYELTVQGTDGSQLFDEKEVLELVEEIIEGAVWVEDESGIQEMDQLMVNSFGQHDPDLDSLYEPGTIEKSRDRLLAASAVARGKKRPQSLVESCLVPANGPLDMNYCYSFRVRENCLDGRPREAFNVKGSAWLTDSLERALQRSGLDRLWVEANNARKRFYVVEKAIEVYRKTHTGRTGVPQWGFLHDSFETTASAVGAMREPAKAGALLESMAETVCNGLTERKHHAWRTSKTGNAPQQTDGEYRAWRRPCGNGLWLKWWETTGDILFATVSGHDDFSQLPPVGNQAGWIPGDVGTSRLAHRPR